MSNSISSERLAEIKARCDVATPGPWHDPFFNPIDESWARRVPADADFIAYARDDIPNLVDEVERLQALVGKCPDGSRCLRTLHCDDWAKEYYENNGEDQ